jgi:hypothetical protein
MMHTLNGAGTRASLGSISLAMVAVAALGGSVASAACGGSSSPPFAQDTPGDSGTSSGSTSGGSGSGGGSGSSSSGSQGFSQGDSGGGMGTGVCQTGMYTGTFSCGFILNPGDAGLDASSPDASPFPPITGNLSFVLSQSTHGELGQDMASGTFVLNAGLTTGMANLDGTLDCASGQFTGSLSGGTYSISFFGLPFFSGTFEGPLTSAYNGTSFSFTDGTWALNVANEGECPGTWTANYVGAADASPD